MSSMRGVFTTKRDTGYDDRIEERYHFPSNYIGIARGLGARMPN
jgi:hypothetical protein